VTLALRGALLFAATLPLFVATDFHPAWWQVLIAAAAGSALGQGAALATRGHRVAQIVVSVVAIALGLASMAMRARGPRAPAPPMQMLVRGALTWDDVHAVEQLLPPAAPWLQKSAQVISEADLNWMTRVIGTTPDYFAIRKLALAEGRLFTSSEADKVAVIGDRLLETLHAAVGQTIRIDRLPFTVIGVLAHQGTSEVGEDRDDVVYVPDDIFAKRLLGDTRTFRGSLLVGDPSRLEQLRQLLRDRHFGKDDVTISVPPGD